MAKLSWWQVVLSVLAAGFGVQSEEARHRDFKSGHPLVYLLVGVVMTVLLVIGLVSLARWVSP